MERKSIVIKNDVYAEKAFYLRKLFCRTENVEMCDKCRLRFHCWTIRPDTHVVDTKPNFAVYRGDMTVWLSNIMATNKEHKNIQEFSFMMEEYMFGHMLNLTESAKVAVWMSQ